MVYKGALNKRDGEIHVYLFDHAILFTKLAKTKQHEQYKVYRRVRFGVFGSADRMAITLNYSLYLWSFC
jgi:hypothetical protein